VAYDESFDAFAEYVRNRLSRPLPGLDFQLRMAPSHREALDTELARSRPHKESAVLILLYPVEGAVSTIYTIRRADLRHHGGQVSFPGGRRNPGEPLSETALREAEEEVGIDRAAVDVLGALTPLFIPPSQFMVHPFVAVCCRQPTFRAQPSEVEELLEIELATLLDPPNRQTEQWEIDGEVSDVPFFAVAGQTIWGATAMITNELLEVIC